MQTTSVYLSPVIMVIMKSGSLFVESSLSWVYGYDPKTKSFRHFPYNENSTRALSTTSLICCLQSTDAIDRREKFTHAYEGSRSPYASSLIWNAPSFREKKSDSFLTELYIWVGLIIALQLIPHFPTAFSFRFSETSTFLAELNFRCYLPNFVIYNYWLCVEANGKKKKLKILGCWIDDVFDPLLWDHNV